MKIGIGISIAGVNGGLDAATLALMRSLSTPLSSTAVGRLDKLVRGLKASGAWAKRDAYWIVTETSEASLKNLKNPSTFAASLVGAPTFTPDRDFVTDGVDDAIDLGFNPATAGGLFTQNSASFSIWSRTAGQIGSSVAGWFDGTDGITLLPRSGSDLVSYRINQASADTIANLSGLGWYTARRSAAGAYKLDKNGAALETGSITSTALNSSTVYLGRSATAAFVAFAFAGAAVGGDLSDAEALAEYNAILAYMQAIGVV